MSTEMKRLQLTITGQLLGWRKLSQYEYSGVVYLLRKYLPSHPMGGLNTGDRYYTSYIKFQSLEYFPRNINWDEHLIGENTDGYYILYTKHKMHPNRNFFSE